MGATAELSLHRGARGCSLALTLMGGAFLAAWFIHRDVFEYLGLDPGKLEAYYWSRRYGLLLHISAGSLALLIGLVQVWLGRTGRTHALHRGLGRIYLGVVLLGGSGALYLLATIPPPAGMYRLGLVGLEVAWLATTLYGYLCIRRGAVLQHRQWMMRSYVVTFGFVTLRVIESALAALGIGTEDSRVAAAAWSCWTVPLLITEVLLRRRRSPMLPVAGGA